jgi:hypothetical protein
MKVAVMLKTVAEWSIVNPNDATVNLKENTNETNTHNF